MLATVVLILATVLGAVLASQPAYLVTLAVVGLGCVAGILVACLTRPGDGRAQKERSRFRVVGVRVAGVVGALLVAAGLLVLRPLPAEPVAVVAMSGSAAVSVADSTSRIELVGHRATTAGVVDRTCSTGCTAGQATRSVRRGRTNGDDDVGWRRWSG